MKISKPLVIFDLETTGTWVGKDKIVEIGMIKLMPDGTRQEYIKRANPGISIPPNVSRIINIKDEDVKDAPPFKDIAKEVLERPERLVYVFDGDLHVAPPHLPRAVDTLLSEELIVPDVDPRDLAAEIEALMTQELAVEDRLNDEVREILKKFEGEIESGRMDYRKLFDMTKQKLIRERNIVV